MKATKFYTHKIKKFHEFWIEFDSGISVCFDRKNTFYHKELNGNEFFKIYREDLPKWAEKSVKSLENNKEQFEIKFHYFENGFYKNGIEYIDVNCFKQDENMHEKAKQQFLKDYSDKYNSLEIVSVTYC